MVLQNLAFHPTDTDHTEKAVVTNHVGVELVGHPDIVPVGGRIAVLHQTLHLVRTQMAPAVSGLFHLLVSEIILIVPMQILLIYKILVNPIIRKEGNLIHNALF